MASHVESNLHLTEGQRTKLAGIAAGAEVNVNADWNAISGDAQILNKPNTLTGYGITDVPNDNKTYGRLNGAWSEIDTSGGGGGGSIIYITWSALKALRDAGTLVPGQSYRITNYVCTTISQDTRSAGNLFDIIVTALSSNKLSENASATYHVGDTYFSSNNAKLESWKLKYCIDNDTTRFDWADNTNGKGVIYRMIDEFNNDVPYDFKNIQFKKSNTFLYTFGGTTDNSLTGGCHHNTMMDYILSSVLTLNFNTFGNNCWGNMFGYGCYYNTFGNDYYSNTFGYYCTSNTFGDSCHFNTFGNVCGSNKFGNNCYSNMLGDSCYNNTFGYYCFYNTFGDYCNSNTFGNWCNSNTFGEGCHSNNFYAGISGTTKKDFIRYIVLEDGCRYNNFYSSIITDTDNYLQRIRIRGLGDTESTPLVTQISLSETNTNYEWLICYTSGGTLKQYCPDNNDTYKLEDTDVLTWDDSTTYTGYGYKAQINIPNLTENDIVSVTFAGVDVISGNYYPTIQIYEGYILVFSKVNTTITIPTIEITKIDL